MVEGIQTSLQWIADAVDGRLSATAAAIEVHGVSTDTRTLQPGELFIALQGPNFDGHQHLEQARAAGAVAALVSTSSDAGLLPQVLVDDTRLALGRLAAVWRQQCPAKVVAITGSNGKTTVKEMTAAILVNEGPTLATRGNFNNDIGLPLTLLRLTPAYRFAVVEMGANHPGEIAALSAIGRPDVAVVNNAGPAHLEGFGDVAGVARAKGEIFSGLGDDGVAVVNGDDRYAETWCDLAGKRRHLRFGIGSHGTVPADVRATAIDAQTFTLHTPSGNARVKLPLPGRHNIANALAAAAAAHALGVPVEGIAAGLQRVDPVAGRLNVATITNGATLIDDTYNANPASLDAALAVLMECPGRHILVLGDLAELGPDTDAIHRQIGDKAHQLGVDALYSNGPASRLSSEAFGTGGQHFDSVGDLVATLQSKLDTNTTVLVKGSRSAAMERVANELTKKRTEQPFSSKKDAESFSSQGVEG